MIELHCDVCKKPIAKIETAKAIVYIVTHMVDASASTEHKLSVLDVLKCDNCLTMDDFDIPAKASFH